MKLLFYCRFNWTPNSGRTYSRMKMNLTSANESRGIYISYENRRNDATFNAKSYYSFFERREQRQTNFLRE